MAEAWTPPAPPNEPQQEGARWRFHRPTSSDVAAWFGTQPLDEGMSHEHYVGGVVLIPQNEKVRYTRPDGHLFERHEQVFTPYMQIGTRLGYSRKLAEYRELIRVIEPDKVPRSQNPQSIYFNGNMAEGLWWHCVSDGGQTVRYLCATAVVSFYEPTSYLAKLKGEPSVPVFGGSGTKQVAGGPDPNGIMKAQTGAIGRALGVAGILVVGTGIATAEDMQEIPGYGSPGFAAEAAQLPAVPTEIPDGPQPEAQDPAEALEALRAKALALQARMQEGTPGKWSEFVAWWQERCREEKWAKLEDAPYDALKGVVSRMENLHAEGIAENEALAANQPTEGGA